MNVSKTMSMGSRMGGSMYESESQRLQREADNFTKKFEHEKKRLMILEDQYKQMLLELAEKREHLKSVRPPTAQMKKDEHKIRLFENQLDQALIRYNDIQTQNRTLRADIDVMRKEHRNQLRVNKNLSKDISSMSDTAKKMNQSTFSSTRLSEETNNQILALKANHELQKQTFERNIKSLQEKLKEKDQREEDLEEEKKKTLAGIKASKDTLGKTKAGTGPVATQEFANPVAVLKLRLNKWTTNNKEKKSLMDMYNRNVKIIEDAFDQIKEATGISSTEEIVTTFIKAEEQNYSLYNYVNMLNSEIDTIAEQNRNIERQIAKHEQLAVMSQQEKDKMRARLTSEIEETTAASVAKEQQIHVMEQNMIQIKDSVQSTVEKFNQANSVFPLMVAKHMQYDSDTQFNEQNVTLYLAELEEYTSMLITYLAYKNEMPDAAVSALSLEAMVEKDKDGGPLHIEAPSAHDVNVAEDAETEDDFITNGKDLYKRFENLVQKDHINIGNNNSKGNDHSMVGGGRNPGSNLRHQKD